MAGITAITMRSLAAGCLALLLAAGCGSTPHASVAVTRSPTPITEPTRDPGKDSLPLLAEVHVGASAHSFQGGDDHVGLVIDNRGRDLQDLVVLAPAWVAARPGHGHLARLRRRGSQCRLHRLRAGVRGPDRVVRAAGLSAARG